MDPLPPSKGGLLVQHLLESPPAKRSLTDPRHPGTVDRGASKSRHDPCVEHVCLFIIKISKQGHMHSGGVERLGIDGFSKKTP